MAVINFDFKDLRDTLDASSLSHRNVFNSIGSQLYGSALSAPGQELREMDNQIMRAERNGDQDQLSSLQSSYDQKLTDSYQNFQKALLANSPNTQQLTNYVSPQLQGIDQVHSNLQNMTQVDFEKAVLNNTSPGDLLLRNLNSFPGVSNQAGVIQGLQAAPQQQAVGLDLSAIQAAPNQTAQAGLIASQVGSLFQSIPSQNLLADPRFTPNSGIGTLQNVAQGLGFLGYNNLSTQLLQNPAQTVNQLSQSPSETFNQFRSRLGSILS